MRPILGLAFGLAISLFLTLLAGENPVNIFFILAKSSFGSWEDFSLCLFYTSSLIFTGLSVALVFHAGLFNIGAEGQLTIACLTSTAASLSLPFQGFANLLCSVVLGLLAGGGWGALAGFLKAYRGAHEVIVTMMLNFIASGILSYFILNQLQNPDSQAPESRPLNLSSTLIAYDPLKKLIPNSPINSSIFVGILVAVILWVFLYRTKWGFNLRALGQNSEAASFAGINSKVYISFAFFGSGAIAGLVGINEIFGSAGKLSIGFSANLGFIGIAVALLGRNHPIGILASAFLFGILQKGAQDLDFETESITRDFARIIQAIVILSVVVFAKFDLKKELKRLWLVKKS